MDCTIEILTENNWQILKDLWLEALQNDSIAYASSYDEEAALSEAEWRKKFEAGTKYVAVALGKYVGLAGATFEKKIKLQHTADLAGFYVVAEYRGKGIGRALLERILSDLRSNPKIMKVRLAVGTTQTNAIKLYRDLGFVETGVARKAVKIGDVYYDHMRMELIFEDKL